MRLFHALPIVLLGCDGGGPGDDTDTDVPPPNFTFREVVPVGEFTATLNENTLIAHQMQSMMLASVGVVSADIAAQDILLADGAAVSSRLRGASTCWDRPPFYRWSFVMNFATPQCENFGMTGAVEVENDPAGMVLYNFSSFTIEGREMGGSFAFDRRGASPESYFWLGYNTSDDQPGPDNDTKLGIEIDSTVRGLSYDGGVNLSVTNGVINFWGEATVGEGEGAVRVVHGAEAPGLVRGDDPPGTDVLSMPLLWTDCRCPISGLSSLDMPLEIREVTIDLDAMEEDPDDVDDPAINIPVAATLDGRAVLDHTGCGSYDVDFQLADGQVSTVAVESRALFAEVQFLCDTRSINDVERCNAFFRAITALPETFQVSFSDADLDTTAANAVLDEFDTTWCRIYE